jgi:starch synthase (maltosyl-transferring)
MPSRVVVLQVTPVVDGGRWAAKSVPGEEFEVAATLVCDGHELLGAQAVLTDASGRRLATPMSEQVAGTDRWTAVVAADAVGDWALTVEAWIDLWAGWCYVAGRKIPAGVDIPLVLHEGAALLASATVPPADTAVITDAVAVLRDDDAEPSHRLAATAPLAELLAAHPIRSDLTASDPLPLRVEPERALVGSWYEFFPRSIGATKTRSGNFETATRRLPAIARMGFDVVYLPPIHPIGRSHRKGPNNSLTPGPHDPGSPWAIGGPDGGHDAVHPDLGTVEDLVAFIGRAAELGLDVALDLALQASPDHPWVAEHPDWFRHRLDGSIAYAENPPKKYQDIYPLWFDDDPEGLTAEVIRVLRHWMALGVRIFRVDNPHTKPLWFWDRVLTDIRGTDPDVIFLSEAFTRPAMLHTLAKVGFHQSYTYFTWRTDKDELADYLAELSGPGAVYLRPNLFVNTPDILHASLQHGGPPMFAIRAVLAATASPSWGVYSGYELFESVAVREGSEEYLDSEKYQYRPRKFTAAERDGRSLAPLLTRLNQIRAEHPALRRLRGLQVHPTDDDAVLAYSRSVRLPDGGQDQVITVVSLDPHQPRETLVHLDSLVGPDDRLTVRDELSGRTWVWGQTNYVRLTPEAPAHILAVTG